MFKFTHELLAAFLTDIQPPVSVCRLPVCLCHCVFLPFGCLCMCLTAQEKKRVTEIGDGKALEQNNRIISVLQEWTFDGVLCTMSYK